MCYLRFDKAQMTNLQESLYKEMLITNRSGAYCSTTLVGCNIRKYDGLLVIPVPELDDENHVLLSSCAWSRPGARPEDRWASGRGPSYRSRCGPRTCGAAGSCARRSHA